MNTQSEKERKRKTMTISLGVVFLLIGGGLLAGKSFGRDVEGPVIMFLYALCFFAIAGWSKKNWWAIIPGGLFASIGLVAALENFIPHYDYPRLPNTIQWGVYTWVMFLGLATTFGILWLLRKTRPTGWARYPAAGLLVMAVSFFILGSRFQEFCLATVLLVVGVMLLLTVFTRKKLPVDQ
jgi:hypothetical protein